MAEPATTAELPTLKVLLIGSSGVGKSALVYRYTADEFLGPEDAAATIGVDYRMKSIHVGGKWFKLSIWDTAGQERYRTLTSSYYRGAQGVIIVYDVTSQDTFDAIPSWLQELDVFTGDVPPIKLLVGNKVDRAEARAVDEAQGAAAAARFNSLFAECSAKDGTGVEDAFHELVSRIASTPELWQDVDPSVRRPGDRIPGGAPSQGGTVSLGDPSSYVGAGLAAARERCNC